MNQSAFIFLVTFISYAIGTLLSRRMKGNRTINTLAIMGLILVVIGIVMHLFGKS